MTSIESNRAAWLVSEGANPLQVSQGPDQTNPEADEIIIHVAAVAINPSEPYMQEHPMLPLKYPHVLGSDVAGTVVKIGSGVTRFNIGDRVIGHCLGLIYGGARHGGFQEFTACREAAVAKIPGFIPFEQASVLPLSISTSATALYEQLKLRQPTVEPTKTGRDVVLIWGGATSIGSSAIQFAVASGYKVVTTASAKNHEYVKSLVSTGQEDVTVFDYADADITAKIISHIKESGLTFSGAYDCISTAPTLRVCADVVASFGGGSISVVLPGVESPREDVKLQLVWATNAGMIPEAGAQVWEKFVPAALEKGTFKAMPPAKIVGKGLEQIQDTINAYKKGVSATKLVVQL
jgi:NADPH:quinone reductase-like Zn-dependent oxidoreductase